MQIKHLTSDQFDLARQTALERVATRNGDKPTLEQFKNANPLERGLLVLYILATIIFIVAFLVSSQHVIAYANVTAGKAHIPESTTGLTAIVKASWFWVHELGLLLLAETAMMTFMVMARVTSSAWQRGVMYALAISSALFVVWANLQSGLVWYLSILVPAITIGVSMVYEHWFVASIKEERRVRSAYRDAVNAYQTALTNPTNHPDYQPYLRQAVFEMLLAEQSGAGVTARKQWLAGLSVPERAYVADAEIALNDWHIDAIAPTVPTASPTPIQQRIPTQSGDVIVIEEHHSHTSNGNGHLGKLATPENQ